MHGVRKLALAPERGQSQQPPLAMVDLARALLSTTRATDPVVHVTVF